MPYCVLACFGLDKGWVKANLFKVWVDKDKYDDCHKDKFYNELFQVTTFNFMSHYSKPQFGEIILKPDTLCEDLLVHSTVMF